MSQVFKGSGFHASMHPSGDVHFRVDFPEKKYFPIDVQRLAKDAQALYDEITNTIGRLPAKATPLDLIIINKGRLEENLVPVTSRKMIFNVNSLVSASAHMRIPDSRLLPFATNALRQSGYAKDGDMIVMSNAEDGTMVGSFLFNSAIPKATSGSQRTMNELGGIMATLDDGFEKLLERPIFRSLTEPALDAYKHLERHNFQLGEPSFPKVHDISLPSLELIIK